MKLKLSEVQVEQVGVTCLDKLHHDIGLELVENAINGGSGLEPDEVQAMLRILVSIEVVMKELMHPDIYFVWKMESGVDL